MQENRAEEIEKVKRLEAKRAAIEGGKKKRGRSLWALLVVAGLLGGGLISYYQAHSTDRSVAQKTYVEGRLITPVSTFDDGRAHFYRHKQGDIEIRYFAIKSSDGIMRAAFDACDACWPAGKGYAQDGDFMVCRNCGLRFSSVKINEVKGGCNPAPLARTVQEGNLIIEMEDILKGKRYFDFERKG